jgi:hypothetical protein
MKWDNAGIKVFTTTSAAGPWTSAGPPLAIALIVSSREREANKGVAIRFTPGTKESVNAQFIFDCA